MAGPLTTRVIGKYASSERDRRVHEALSIMRQGLTLTVQACVLSDMEILAMLAALFASVADDVKLRGDAADILEGWSKLLRSDQPVSFKAKGNA